MDRAVDASDLSVSYLRVCAFGNNATGKTTFLGTFPKPLLVVSFEPILNGGADVLSGVSGVRVLRYGTAEQVKDRDAEFSDPDEAVALARHLVAAKGSGYATVGVDSATSFQDAYLRKMMTEVGKDLPQTLGFGTVPEGLYQKRSEAVKEGLRPFLDVPAHVVVLAKEKDHNPPKQEVRSERTGKVLPDLRNKIVRGMQPQSWVAPDLGFSAMSWLLDATHYRLRFYFDREVVVHRTPNPLVDGEFTEHEVETGRYTLRARCRQHAQYATGGKYRNPDKVPDDLLEPSFEGLMAVVRGEG